MEDWRKIDKHRLTIFTDAIMAIIMTILILDLKVPKVNDASDHELGLQLFKQLPHFLGFVISFLMIVIIWFSHHDLMAGLQQPDRTFTTTNFLFTGAIAAFLSPYIALILIVSVPVMHCVPLREKKNKTAERTMGTATRNKMIN